MAVTFAATQFACTEDAGDQPRLGRASTCARLSRKARKSFFYKSYSRPRISARTTSPSHFELARPVEDSPVVRRFRDLAREFVVVVPLVDLRALEQRVLQLAGR